MIRAIPVDNDCNIGCCLDDDCAGPASMVLASYEGDVIQEIIAAYCDRHVVGSEATR